MKKRLYARNVFVPGEATDAMRRFACHRLYALPGECLAKGVVELGEDGKVHGWFPLEEEINTTQWIGGVIVLSAAETMDRVEGESFRSFLERGIALAGKDIYAWYITDFDFVKGEFTSRSKCVRL